MTVTDAVLFAIVVGILTSCLCLAALLCSFSVQRGRILKHNVNHALTPILLELDRLNEGLTDDTERAKLLLKATRAWLHPIGEQEIPLKPFFKPLVASYQVIEFYPLANPVVKVNVGELYAIVINCIQNALEAREASLTSNEICEIEKSQITITLEENAIRISNPATPADCAALLGKGKSTRGLGRGQGIRSIMDSCKAIGWDPSWEMDGTRVVTTLIF